MTTCTASPAIRTDWPTLAARPGPAAALTAELGQALGATPDAAVALTEFLGAEPLAGGRLVAALIAPSAAERSLLARSWRCAGWARLTPAEREEVLADGAHEWLPADTVGGGDEAWWDDLRARLAPVVASRVAGQTPGEAEGRDLARLVALDADVRLRRLARLAARRRARGADPAAAEAAARLEAADRQTLARRIAAGTPPPPPDAFAPRLREVLGADEVARLRAAATATSGLERLARVLKALDRERLTVPDPAAGLTALLAVAARQEPVSLVAARPDPLLLAAFVLERGERGRVVFPLPAGRAAEARRAEVDLPEGVAVEDQGLVVDCGAASLATPDRAEEDARRSLEGNAALKDLVLSNLQSTSALTAFLRDPKVSAIPGLVEEVVNRTRNPQILETIATDRTLHGGFANRGVPLALLKSPVNVSIKIIRRFVHVKYVPKIELKRLAVDASGIRKEVNREVVKYLKALA